MLLTGIESGAVSAPSKVGLGTAGSVESAGPDRRLPSGSYICVVAGAAASFACQPIDPERSE